MTYDSISASRLKVEQARGKQRQQLSGALRVNIGHWLGLFLLLPESWQFRPVPQFSDS